MKLDIINQNVDVVLCFAGERGDGGEAGGPVSSHCVQHGDAGLQEDPWESVSNGLEPKHVKLLVANTGPQPTSRKRARWKTEFCWALSRQLLIHYHHVHVIS